MKLELGKSYKTRDGRKARVICVDREGYHHPVLALIKDENGKEDAVHLYQDGSHFGDGKCDADLVSEWIEKPVVDWALIPQFKAIALDSYGIWRAYSHIPERAPLGWRGNFLAMWTFPESMKPKFEGPWQESLVVFEEGAK